MKTKKMLKKILKAVERKPRFRATKVRRNPETGTGAFLSIPSLSKRVANLEADKREREEEEAILTAIRAVRKVLGR